MSIAKETLTEKARSGYCVCYAADCPLRDGCLRWLVGQQMPATVDTYHCVNPRSEGVATERCRHYRNSQKVRFAQGMTHIFTDDMPRSLESAVRLGVIGQSCRTYYFEYRNGKRLIPPAMQDTIRQLFRNNGWAGEVNFDHYIEDYDW